jgi:hypothetical protein
MVIALAVRYYFTGHQVPAGQPPLADLDSRSLDALKSDFNAASDGIRIILLLSPTWPVCLRGASAVQKTLEQQPAAEIRVFAVWEPILPTDLTAPGTGALYRLSDRRVRQFWDKEHVLAKLMSQDSTDRQSKPGCCTRPGILWDLIATYPADAVWNTSLPPAIVFNGPVVRVAPTLKLY